MTKQRIIVSKDLSCGHGNPEFKRNLKLLMICCEEAAPYGPAEATAHMFLELLYMSYGHLASMNEHQEIYGIKSISIAVYHAQHEDYPASKEEWDSYDGCIIPGSLSSAYDTHINWIKRLHDVIRDEIHANRRKTLAVCFGHQSFAHALGEMVDPSNERNGEACMCPSGKKAGRKSFNVTPVGKLIFGSDLPCLEMLYTHGDMVNSLPRTGLCLGGNEDVPIQSAAYFASEECALKYKENASEGKNDTSTIPYALTFQSHPEFISTDGFNVNFVNIVEAMEKLKHIDAATAQEACADAKQTFDRVKLHSLDATMAVAMILGWFP